MKTYAIVILLSLMVYQLCDAQAKQEKNANKPKIVFNKTTHNFGEIKQHDAAQCEFTFSNKGKSPLIISNVKTSCGCTVPSWPNKPIMPGDSASIKVKYSATDLGVFEKFIDIYSNASKEIFWVRIKGTVINNVNKKE